jgi:two-component system OmpR family sensor kinase
MLTQIESAFNAQEASERKLRRFVADASHELRTPLAAVRAYAELFSRGAARRPADLERSMAGISRESERMSLLVEDLLLLARLDEGRPLAHDQVELDEVVAESVETARMLEPARSITCRLDPATVIGDRDRLRQVVDNLLSNAIAYNRDGGTVFLGTTTDGISSWILVRDTGVGISDADRSRLFQRFFKAGTPRRAGTGLGLAITRDIVRAHGGDLGLHSSPGAGSTFVVKLPAGSATVDVEGTEP